jgi:hypothetical protein
MDVYLASPNNQLQAHTAMDMPVLLSFAICQDWLNDYQQSFRKILIDSGAFSEFSSGKKIDLERYIDWSERWKPHAEAIAGLDDISGDWRKSLSNYQKFENGFPTFHESDPIEFLDDCVAIAKERKQWLGIGMIPPRGNKEYFVRDVLERIPEGIHVHGWAMRAYTYCRRIDSVDSTNWWRDAFDLKAHTLTKHLTYAECLEIVVKKYKRWNREIKEKKTENIQSELFDVY